MPSHYVLKPFPSKTIGQFGEIYQVLKGSKLITNLIAKGIRYASENKIRAYLIFFQEVKAAYAAGLFVDYGVHDNAFFLIMKKIRGKTLLKYMLDCCPKTFEAPNKNMSNYSQCINHILNSQNKKEFKRDRIDKIIPALGKAIEQFHKKTDHTHGDLHPENIIVTPHNELKVIDFGLSARATTKNKHDDFVCAFKTLVLTNNQDLIWNWRIHYIIPGYAIHFSEIAFIIAARSYWTLPDSQIVLAQKALAKVLFSRHVSYSFIEPFMMESEFILKKKLRFKDKNNPEKIFLMIFHFVMQSFVLALMCFNIRVLWGATIQSLKFKAQEDSKFSLMASLSLMSYLVYKIYDSVKFGAYVFDNIICSLVSSKEDMDLKIASLTHKKPANLILVNSQRELLLSSPSKKNSARRLNIENLVQSKMYDYNQSLPAIGGAAPELRGMQKKFSTRNIRF